MNPLQLSKLVWYTCHSCAGPIARRMLTFGAMDTTA